MEKDQTNEDKRQQLAIVLLGHVDCGKSTTTGQLLYKCGNVSEDQMNRNKIQCEKYGKSSFLFSWLAYSLKEQKQRGITIINAYKRLFSKTRQFTLIDTPGHRDFIKWMIKGAFQADAAILVVAAPLGQFAAGISDYGQTRQHLKIATAVGIKQFVICINKMDDLQVNYSEVKFNQIKDEMKDYLKNAGLKNDNINFIPTSAFLGQNIIEKSKKMLWYNGPCLLDVMNSFKRVKLASAKPLRISVQKVHKISGAGTVVEGKVISGVLKLGKTLHFSFNNLNGIGDSIQKYHQPIQQAYPGDQVGIRMKGLAIKDICRGQIISQHGKQQVRLVQSFQARILFMTIFSQIHVGYSPVFYFNSRMLACKITKILSRLDKRTGMLIEENPKSLKSDDSAIVIIEPIGKLNCEVFADYPNLGRFLVQQMKNVIGVGVVRQIKYKQILKK